jgi:hypothetical protein
MDFYILISAAMKPCTTRNPLILIPTLLRYPFRSRIIGVYDQANLILLLPIKQVARDDSMTAKIVNARVK